MTNFNVGSTPTTPIKNIEIERMKKMSRLSKINDLAFELRHETEKEKRIVLAHKIYELSEVTPTEYDQTLLIQKLIEPQYRECPLLSSISLLREQNSFLAAKLDNLTEEQQMFVLEEVCNERMKLGEEQNTSLSFAKKNSLLTDIHGLAMGIVYYYQETGEEQVIVYSRQIYRMSFNAESKKGDKVRYIGTDFPELTGKVATIIDINSEGYVICFNAKSMGEVKRALTCSFEADDIEKVIEEAKSNEKL